MHYVAVLIVAMIELMFHSLILGTLFYYLSPNDIPFWGGVVIGAFFHLSYRGVVDLFKSNDKLLMEG